MEKDLLVTRNPFKLTFPNPVQDTATVHIVTNNTIRIQATLYSNTGNPIKTFQPFVYTCEISYIAHY